jgi:Domain of unknown function (DUF4136)
MRSISTVLVVFLALTGLTGCASSVEVDSFADPDFSFGGYGTFFWMTPKAGMSDGDIGLSNPRLDRTVRNAIESTLVARGFVKTTDGSPDFRVAYILSIDPRTEITQLNRFYGYGSDWTDAYVWPNNVQVHEDGTLIIDVIDDRTKEMVWRGIGSGEIDRTRPEDTQAKNVTQAVEKILKRFPPQ